MTTNHLPQLSLQPQSQTEQSRTKAKNLLPTCYQPHGTNPNQPTTQQANNQKRKEKGNL